MRLFWKVSSCNFKYFVSYISNKYSDCNINGLKKMNRYYTNGDDNLYICVEKKIRYSSYQYYFGYCRTRLCDYEFLIDNGYVYMGEYYSRKQKLNKLNNISNNNDIV